MVNAKQLVGKLKIAVIVCLLFLVGAELFLRFYLGMGHMLLYREDKDFEYIEVADQHLFRFRNHLYYNHYSMRSDEVNPKAIKILGFGDSVVNGGAPTDQDSLATTILSKELTKDLDTAVQLLNISAPSWGPSNCFAYLRKYGDFDAKTIILFVNSHDAYDNMTFEKVVGTNDFYPDKNYKLALSEAWKYAKRMKRQQKSVQALGGADPFPFFKLPGSVFDSGFQNFYTYCQQRSIKLIICLHPKIWEREAHKYESEGEEIIQFAKSHNITLIQELDYPMTRDDYRDDGMHYNSTGQRKLSQILLPYLLNQYSKKQASL